jgi:hypothetical protein
MIFIKKNQNRMNLINISKDLFINFKNKNRIDSKEINLLLKKHRRKHYHINFYNDKLKKSL